MPFGSSLWNIGIDGTRVLIGCGGYTGQRRGRSPPNSDWTFWRMRSVAGGRDLVRVGRSARNDQLVIEAVVPLALRDQMIKRWICRLGSM